MRKSLAGVRARVGRLRESLAAPRKVDLSVWSDEDLEVAEGLLVRAAASEQFTDAERLAEAALCGRYGLVSLSNRWEV